MKFVKIYEFGMSVDLCSSVNNLNTFFIQVNLQKFIFFETFKVSRLLVHLNHSGAFEAFHFYLKR